MELHEHGMLAISGEGTRVTLSAHETVDLLNWLMQQRKSLLQAARAEPTTGELPDWLHEADEKADGTADDEERELPVDEP